MEQHQKKFQWKKLLYDLSISDNNNNNNMMMQIDMDTFAEQFKDFIGHSNKAEFIDWKNNDFACGRTMLICAAHCGRWDIVQLLLEHGADVNIADKDGRTALMHACKYGEDECTDTVKLLLEHDNDATNINIADKDGKTALILALEARQNDKANLLLDKGADINVLGDTTKGETVLMLALEAGFYDTSKRLLLLDKGADINLILNNKWGKEAFMTFCHDGQYGSVKLMVEMGADINMADGKKKGKTALMYALQGGHIDTVVKLLLDKGANIHIIADHDGKTALMWAAEKGYNDIVKLFLENGADSSMADHDGKTALMLAFRNGHTEIVKLLMETTLIQDIESLLDAGVTIERLEELYSKEEVHSVVQARIIEEQVGEEAMRAGTPAAWVASTEDNDEETAQVPRIPNPSEIERSQSQDIGSLLDGGATMEKLEEIYPKEKVRKVVQEHIVKQPKKEEDGIQRRRRGSMARLLFLRSKSTALKEVLKSSAVMDQVLLSLLADPEEEILMCPLMRKPLKDPVVISSGFVMDRSTALDENGHLRMQLCPFSRNVLFVPVYPCIPIRSKLKAWEAERMNRCIGVAEKMVESKDEWERATKVFDIAETLLQEMGDQTYLNVAAKLASLERKIPFVENDVERMVKIHERLIRAAKGDRGETVRLLREAIKDCCGKLRGLILSDDLEECTRTRLAYSKDVLSPMALIDNQAELRDEILELHRLDFDLAKMHFGSRKPTPLSGKS